MVVQAYNSTSEVMKEINKIIEYEPQIFLDYDGTLVPIVNDPIGCYFDSELNYIISEINKRFEMYIITGRSLDDTRRCLGNLNIIALHGALFYINNETLKYPGFDKFLDSCNKIFLNYKHLEDLYHGLRIYNKNGGVLFHLGNVDNRDEIIKIVDKIAFNNNLESYHGINIVEIRFPGINKGRAIKMMRNRKRPVIIFGDDLTDEDSFIENTDAITVKIGPGNTAARFRLKSYLDVRNILINIINI
ncbi:trehalose-phosphatase [Picrophilus oshimae]|uniref:Trehalose 6-phosphate phosphatase n=1 Tax=Picrophilus torridus (strain ATCC 700027 / DSM 9790 / JCM 10055 / NBRC 100828 / KAW 2/3) TaxID=1122961 RepID=Q6KZQ7_PICTO|nr:trehalose-phosphatase [Picrophilus oshimae]AAT43795.1 trehalose-phosphatase [Picrophilus oshimae DSM 9789]